MSNICSQYVSQNIGRLKLESIEVYKNKRYNHNPHVNNKFIVSKGTFIFISDALDEDIEKCII